MDNISLFYGLAANGLLCGLLASCLRIQLNLFGGFDLLIGGAVSVSAAIGVSLSTAMGQNCEWWQVVGSITIASAVVTLLWVAWNRLLSQAYTNGRLSPSLLLVSSIGANLAVVSVVGLVAGSGVKMADGCPERGNSIDAIFLLLSVCCAVGIASWWRSRFGFGNYLIGQNARFAAEIGLDLSGSGFQTVLVCSTSIALAGCYVGLRLGASPQVGEIYLVPAICGMLAVDSPNVIRTIFGGVLLGAVLYLLGLAVDPRQIQLLAYSLLAGLLLLRGSSRIEQGLR